jgi:hypothetical protein
MKRVLLIFTLTVCFISCKKAESNCGTYKNGQQLFRGPEGGCYYENSNGNKTYVEREAFNC